MINKKWMALAGSLLLAFVVPIQANNYIAIEQGDSFPFTQIEGFFVSPIQQKTTLLAPFAEARGGYMHEGVDVEAEFGTPIFAVEEGTIIKAAPDSKGVDAGGGHMVFIDHGNGIQSRYMHLSFYTVKNGDQVKAGDVIGFSGDSGDATKPLLHYELRVDDVPVDPTFIFESNNMFAAQEEEKEEVTFVEPFLVPQT